MGEWSDYMKENEMLEYVNNTRDNPKSDRIITGRNSEVINDL